MHGETNGRRLHQVTRNMSRRFSLPKPMSYRLFSGELQSAPRAATLRQALCQFACFLKKKAAAPVRTYTARPPLLTKSLSQVVGEITELCFGGFSSNKRSPVTKMLPE